MTVLRDQMYGSRDQADSMKTSHLPAIHTPQVLFRALNSSAWNNILFVIRYFRCMKFYTYFFPLFLSKLKLIS